MLTSLLGSDADTGAEGTLTHRHCRHVTLVCVEGVEPRDGDGGGGGGEARQHAPCVGLCAEDNVGPDLAMVVLGRWLGPGQGDGGGVQGLPSHVPRLMGGLWRRGRRGRGTGGGGGGGGGRGGEDSTVYSRVTDRLPVSLRPPQH